VKHVDSIRRFPSWTAAGLIAALACVLYGPFLASPRVFDDWVFFSGEHFFYYATHPFGLDVRLPAYFSLAVTDVLVGGMQAHRLVSLALHAACALLVFKLTCDLLQAPTPQQSQSPDRARAWALVGAALFAIHPVAVYGAGYLVQRTIVVATLFSLASMVLLLRGARGRSYADAVLAALMYWIAVLSKEHSVLLPAAAVLALPVVASDRRFAVRLAGTYLVCCAPAAIFVTLVRKGVIGQAYEPAFGLMASQMEALFGHSVKDLTWWLSAVTQAGLFFRYVALWMLPDTQAMSIDVRVNFFDAWSAGFIALKVSAFLAWGALGFVLLRRGGRIGVAGFGMLYMWVLFLVEFSAVRFQEPLVLYRSYLWAPGLVIALAAVLSAAPVRAALVALAVAGPILVYQAHDRLTTFSDSLLLWQDAVAKLPEKPVPWGSRTLYMLGREYVYGARPERAMDVAERCMAQYPNTVDCYYARGVIHLLGERPDRALPDLRRAVELQPDSGVAHHRLGLVLERLGRFEDAKAQYQFASKLGFGGAGLELQRIERIRARQRHPAAQTIPKAAKTQP
jgi:tetratricopeptide (TPR) repeat protein